MNCATLAIFTIYHGALVLWAGAIELCVWHEISQACPARQSAAPSKFILFDSLSLRGSKVPPLFKLPSLSPKRAIRELAFYSSLNLPLSSSFQLENRLYIAELSYTR